MQTIYVSTEKTVESKEQRNAVRLRLTPTDYANVGVLKPYDWSVEDREAHDRQMEKYRQYLMKLCTISREIIGTAKAEE